MCSRKNKTPSLPWRSNPIQSTSSSGGGGLTIDSAVTIIYESIGQQQKEGRWLIFTKWVILSTWLLKSSSPETVLWWALIWDPSIFILCVHSNRAIYVSYLLRPSCHQFSNCGPSKYLTLIFWINAEPYFWAFLLPGKMNTQAYCLKLCPWEDFPSAVFFQTTLE